MAKTTLSDYALIAGLGVVALLVFRNKSTLKSIGSGIDSKISGALNKVDSKINDAAKE